VTRARLAAVALAAVSVGWLDPFAKAREAARLYAAGRYDEAAAQYNEALTHQPDSALLHFNLGDAAYKQGKFTDAVNAFQQSATGGGESARAAYNVGNAKYRLGEAAESSDPKVALGLYAEALAAYRQAMGTAPDDVDAKFNHEFVEKKIADLRKKLEEQQKQQDSQDQQKQQESQDDQKSQDQQKSDDQQQAGDQKKQQPPEPQQQPGNESAPQPSGEGEQKRGEMSQQEAAALLDSQRDQEVSPDEVAKRVQGAVVGETAQDW